MHIVRPIARFLFFALLGIIFLAAGTVFMLYSPWSQDLLRETIVRYFDNGGDMRISMGNLRLRPPLRLEVSDLCMIQHGDTIAAADRLDARVALLPLLGGNVRLDRAVLHGGIYRLGAPDSAMCLTIRAGEAEVSPAYINLATMAIDVKDAWLDRCSVDMVINPDTISVEQEETSGETSGMSIGLRRMRVRSLTYRMRMLPTIDSLGAVIADATLLDGHINLNEQTIRLQALKGSGLNAAYIAPDSATVASMPDEPDKEESGSEPWTITIADISFDNSAGLYTTRGVTPQSGLDFAYIALDSLQLGVHDFYNRGATVRVPLSIQGRERCGITLSAQGVLSVAQDDGLRLDSFAIITPHTALSLNYAMGLGDISSDLSLPVELKTEGHVGTPDIRMMFPVFAPYLAGLPDEGFTTDVEAIGTMGLINIERLKIGLNGCVSLNASGSLSHPMNPENMGADINLNGRIANAAPIARNFMSRTTMQTVKIPHMTLKGHAWMHNGATAGGNITATTGSGKIALGGTWDKRGDKYRATADADGFPVNAFLPLLGIGSVTASMHAEGLGFDFSNTNTTLSAHADINAAEYSGYTYTGLTADATVDNGEARIELHSANPDMLAHISAAGNISGDILNWEIYADAGRIGLNSLGFSTEENTVEAQLRAHASYEPGTSFIKADIDIDRMQMRMPTSEFTIESINAKFTADSVTHIALTNRDLKAGISVDCPLDTLMAHIDSIGAAVSAITQQRRIDAARLQRAIPRMDMYAEGGRNNMLNDILAASKTSMDSISLRLSNDSTLALYGLATGIRTQSARIDTISLNAAQFGSNIFFNAKADNRPGTLDKFAHVAVSGMATDNMAAMRVQQRDIDDKTGYDIGLHAFSSDSTVRASIMPLDPVIGYQQWTVNAGNFISYDFPDKHIDADIRMRGGDSSVEIFTEHVGDNHTQEDLVVQINDIHIQDWLALNPFAPPVKGDFSANLRLNHDGQKQFNGQGTVDLRNFYYGRERVADIHADAAVTTSQGGALTADADISFDGHRAITLRGALNDSTLTSPMSLDLSMINLPLSIVNPVIGSSTGRLRGTLNGALDIEGTTETPTFNGWLALDSAAMFLTMTATDYRISSDTVPVVNNLATFRDFSVFGTNDNPLSVNGTVDIRNMASPEIKLSLKASDMQVVNSRRAARGADIYGKAFIDLDATAIGNFNFMRVNAALKVLSGTNVSYVMPQAVAAIQAKSTGDMVKFVNFNDSVAVAAADTVTRSGMAMLVDANVTFETASTIAVDLSADGKDKVQLQPSGQLSYSLTPMNDNGRLSGRININGGFARYTPPFLGEKLFTFSPDSYIAFNGNMMNPTLSVHAIDVIKANVTQEGQNSRLVNFNVSLDITGTLEQMKVAFDLSTDDDITVSNELQAMSAEQRANQAMNMLLYNVYSGPGTHGDAAIGGNALFSFLESKINSWASENIKGVDLSFGIDQYNRTVDGNTSSTISYSYQVSKSLFDDRFKIVVGGNYSTDANADENFSQNLINDISFEYFLNRAQTMYFRLFRHTGYESILEGEITKTGVGFVYKRKLNSLRDIFRRHRTHTVNSPTVNQE